MRTGEKMLGDRTSFVRVSGNLEVRGENMSELAGWRMKSKLQHMEQRGELLER